MVLGGARFLPMCLDEDGKHFRLLISLPREFEVVNEFPVPLSYRQHQQACGNNEQHCAEKSALIVFSRNELLLEEILHIPKEIFFIYYIRFPLKTQKITRMDNRCLIILPTGEPAGYPQGHINRVYDYIIVPACRLGGFWPARVDHATYDDALDVVKDIVDSDIVICDLSANNTESLYGLAVRQALNLPVTLIKDLKSVVNFYMSDPAIVEYDDSLRIDTVQKSIEALGEALKHAVANKKERHELLNRLSIAIAPATTASAATHADEVMHEEVSEPTKPRLPIISPLPDYVGEPFTENEIGHLKEGDVFFHLNHGKGKVLLFRKMGKEKLASIQFDSGTQLLRLSASDFFRKINS
jgi:hypothetical protein